MPVAGREFRAFLGNPAFHIHRHAFAPRDAAQILHRNRFAARVDHLGADRQFVLFPGHGHRQHHGAELVQRQHGQRHDVALAHMLFEVGDMRIGRKVGAFHIGVRDAAIAVLAFHLIARPHEIAPRHDFHLVRPVCLRQELVHRHGARAEGRDLILEPGHVLRADNIEADGTRRDRHGMRILDEEGHFLILIACGHAGVIVGGPCIGVMAARKREPVFAIHVERVFHHVVPGNADRMDEERAGEVAEAEAGADFRAVDGKGRARARKPLAPFRDLLAFLVEKGEPEFRVFRAMQRPVIRRRHARMDAVIGAVRLAFLFPHQREVGREVERVQIVLPVGQHVVVDADFIERDDARIFREEMPDRGEGLVGVEGQDEDGFRLARLQRAQGRCFMAEKGAAEVFHALHEIAGKVQLRQIVIGVEVAHIAHRVEERDRAFLFQLVHQRMGAGRGQRMAERLEERRAACIVARPPALREVGILEGLDLERHPALVLSILICAAGGRGSLPRFTPGL